MIILDKVPENITAVKTTKITNIVRIIRIQSLLDNNINPPLLEILTKLVDPENPFENNLLQLSKAQYLRHTNRMKGIAEAQAILRQLTKTENIFDELKLELIIDLIEILLLEYKMSSNLEVLNEIIEYLEMILHIAELQNLHPKTVQAMIMMSKIDRISGEYEASYRNLMNAREIAQEHGMISLLSEIKEEIRIVVEEMGMSEKITKNLPDRLLETEIIEYLYRVQGLITDKEDSEE
jgi:hypothetical protein